MKTPEECPKVWQWWQWHFLLAALASNFPGVDSWDTIPFVWHDYDWVDRELYCDTIGGE